MGTFGKSDCFRTTIWTIWTIWKPWKTTCNHENMKNQPGTMQTPTRNQLTTRTQLEKVIIFCYTHILSPTGGSNRPFRCLDNIWRASFVQKIGGECCFFSIDFIINTKTINPILSGNFSEHIIWRFSFVQKMGREGASCLFSIDFMINTNTVWIDKMQ